MSPGDAANLVPAARSLEAHRAVVWPWFIGVLLAGAALSRAASEGAWRASFALVAVLVAGTTAVFGATVFRDVAETQSVKPFIENAARQLPDRTPLYYYAGSHAEPDLYFFKAFEYAAGFYARRPLTVIDRVDVAPGGFTWFITAEATLQQLERNLAPEGEQPSFRVLSRFTYGDNPRRTPMVFVEARRD